MKSRTTGIVVILLVFILPVVFLGVLSAASSWSFPELLPTRYSLRPLLYAGSQAVSILKSIGGSLVYSLAAVALAALICLPAATLFARETFKGKQFLEVALLLPALVPSITFSMGIHYLFVRTGIADSYGGVILVLTMFSYPYMLRALTAGYRAFGKEYTQCAANLGAGRILRLLRIELPLIAPSLIAGGTVVFLVTFTEYFLVFLVGGGAVPSYAGYLFPMLLSSDRPVAALLTLIFLSIPLLLFVGLEFLVVRMYRKKGLM